ncbi:hypothetical protein NA57DRAFT_56788 [Rhizodiscina lignyota]|uniref:Heterokaryon incompatibility domain-containing protein n=1 Tax=Rhizodiscina lignyota TaxID=1504668 RepID=A0A9P4IC63_9PEZI|nr:hypothetical protein NA57DRAFT_56788 [Rhizodiscina lignyota]
MKLFSDPEPYMLCGRETLYLNMKDIKVLAKIFLLTQAKDVERARFLNSRPRPKLVNLLSNLWIAESSDARDVIYGLLNLCSDGRDECLVLDYRNESTTESLYIKYGELCVQRNEIQEILYLAGIGYPRKLSIPSWSPDWTSIPTVPTLRKRHYNASGENQGNFMLVSSTMLSVSAVLVDNIIQIADKAFTSANFTYRSLPNMSTLAQSRIEVDSQNMAKSLPDEYDGGKHHGLQSRDEAFWRTLIGDTEALSSRTHSRTDCTTPTIQSPYNFELRYERPASPEYGRLFNTECALRDQRLSSLTPKSNPAKSKSLWARAQCESKEDPDLVAAWRRGYQKVPDNPAVILDSDMRFTDAFVTCASGRKFAITENPVTGRKRMALVPPEAQVGDNVYVIHGMEVPFVMRRSTNPFPEYWLKMVGECFVHGIMDGEAVHNGAVTELIYVY